MDKHPKKRILVIDDETGFTGLLKLNLEQTGAYEVRTENQLGVTTGGKGNGET